MRVYPSLAPVASTFLNSGFCWFIMSPVFIVTDHCNCFAFSTTILNWKYFNTNKIECTFLYVHDRMLGCSLAIVNGQFCSELWHVLSAFYNFPNYLSLLFHLSFLSIRQTWVDYWFCRQSVATSWCRLYLQEPQIWKQAKRSIWNSCRIIIYDRPKEQSEWNSLHVRHSHSNFSGTILSKEERCNEVYPTLSTNP